MCVRACVCVCVCVHVCVRCSLEDHLMKTEQLYTGNESPTFAVSTGVACSLNVMAVHVQWYNVLDDQHAV